MKMLKSAAMVEVLAARFAANMHRHAGVKWSSVAGRLEARPDAIKVLAAMEASGGEPDVVAKWPGAAKGVIAFCDCSAESPAGAGEQSRRSLCFDDAAWKARKEAKPRGSAMGMAAGMGAGEFVVRLLTEAEYAHLQTVGEFDVKTSSWLATPTDVRERGGALFGDRRYGRVFTYHNGAESYYAVRGWRGVVLV